MPESHDVVHVVQLLTREGAVAKEAALEKGEVIIGRAGTGLACPDDKEMADRHAQVNLIEGRVVVHDSSNGSGIWLRIQGSEGRLLRERDQVWLGAQILIMRRDESGWQISHHGSDGRLLESHRVPATGLFIGRTSDLVLDEKDSKLSRRHAQLVVEGKDLRLYDRGAHNGTYLKLTVDEKLGHADEFRVSANRFRIVASDRGHRHGSATAGGISAAPIASGGTRRGGGKTAPLEADPGSRPRVEKKGSRPSLGLAARLRRLGRAFDRQTPGSDAPERQEPSTEPERHEIREPRKGNAALADLATQISSEREIPLEAALGVDSRTSQDQVEAGSDSCLLVLDSENESFSLEAKAGQTVLDVAKAAGLVRGEPVDWECGDGGCGVCIMGVVEGAERLDPPDPATGEMRTIQITEQVVPDPTRYRLACLARVRGTVRLRKLT